MAKKRGKVATWAGLNHLYKEYRYGPAREVRLPGPQSGERLRGVRRAQALELATDLLGQWRSSHFEFEGPVRAGLRVGLVLDGMRWARADFEAASIVEEGLRTIGAKRPDTEEAQPRYVDRGDFCFHCGKPMPDELVSGGRNHRFCSKECAVAEKSRRDTDILYRQNLASREASRIIQREKRAPQKCFVCGGEFKTLHVYGNEKQKYCSRACYATTQVKYSEIDCLACGKPFKPTNNGRGGTIQFCSVACSNSYGRTTRYDHVCVGCGSSFTSKRRESKYCSARCTAVVLYFQSGEHKPRRFNFEIFDYLFTGPIAVARFEAQQEPQGAGEVVTLSFGQSPSRGKHEPSTAMFLTTGLFDQMMAA